MKANDLEMSGSGIISEEVVLKAIRVSYKYDDEQKRTDIIESIKYDCVDPESFSFFTIKVNTATPVITQEMLETSENSVFLYIPVDEVVIRPYELGFGVAKVSIVAPYVRLLEN